MLLITILSSDYFTDEDEFSERVEKDASEFKPLGEKIYSYKRRIGTSDKGKGKADEPSEELDENSEDVVTYEVYHVSSIFRTNQLHLLISDCPLRLLGILLASGNITVECNSSSYFTLKEVHIFKRMKKAGNLSSCMLSSTSHNL